MARRTEADRRRAGPSATALTTPGCTVSTLRSVRSRIRSATAAASRTLGRLEIVGQLLTERREQRGQGLLDTAGADGDLDCQRFLVEPEPQRRRFDAGQEESGSPCTRCLPGSSSLPAPVAPRCEPSLSSRCSGSRMTRTARASSMAFSHPRAACPLQSAPGSQTQTGRFAQSRASRSRFTNPSSAVAWEMKILPDMVPPRAENLCGTVAAAPRLDSFSSPVHAKGFKQEKY